MSSTPQWDFFTNHAHVLICLAKNSKQPLREVALAVGITERAVQRIVADLEAANYLSRTRHGRQNVYLLRPEMQLRHSLEAHCVIGDLLDVIMSKDDEDMVLGDWTVGGHGSEVRGRI
jgi:DNA-binding MarR family transcriptional regulator